MARIEIEVTDAELKKLKGGCSTNSTIKIVILQRGWIFVGRYSKVGQDCKLEDAKCIRQWGTTKGLGELISGPTSSTKLDDAGTVRFHEMTAIATIDCEESKWNSKL